MSHSSFSTYLKLFVAMGLTWSVEVLAWFLSTEETPAPEAVIIVLNTLNISQVKKCIYIIIHSDLDKLL